MYFAIVKAIVYCKGILDNISNGNTHKVLMLCTMLIYVFSFVTLFHLSLKITEITFEYLFEAVNGENLFKYKGCEFDSFNYLLKFY